MKENNLSWGKVGNGVGIGLVAGMTMFGLGGIFPGDTLNEDKLKTDLLAAMDTKLDASVTELNSAKDELVKSMEANKDAREKILEDDVWESTAEVMAVDELEDKDFKDLRKHILSEYEDDFDNSTDYDEIEDFEVTMKDTDFSGMDTDDQEATVDFEMKVEYENDSGDNVNRYITGTVTIEDGDVEDLEFTGTD